MTMMSSEEPSGAVALVAGGVLTERAGRAMAYFRRHGVFCEAIQSGGEMGIVLLEHWYTPAAFNALMEGRYAPTDDDVAVAISALAAHADAPEPPEPSEPDDADASADEPTGEPAPDAVLQGLRATYGRTTADDAELDAIHQQRSQGRTDGEGAIGWGMLALMVAGAAFAAWALWLLAQGGWGR